MSAQRVATAYLEALESGKTEAILDVFTEDATVNSPLCGERLARDFYPELLKMTRASSSTLEGVLTSEEGGPSTSTSSTTGRSRTARSSSSSAWMSFAAQTIVRGSGSCASARSTTADTS
jgi:ketosteroid isomerase-like protein